MLWSFRYFGQPPARQFRPTLADPTDKIHKGVETSLRHVPNLINIPTSFRSFSLFQWPASIIGYKEAQ
jgi:hypothetical protein